MIKHYEIRIFGRVQGVGFRYAARSKARELGLSGWVENRMDGSVLAEVQGSAEACHAFLRWCREGTGYSWVEKVEVEERDPGQFQGFSIRR
ncbi:MAG: acylphosphatase [Bacteroidales bacterium]